MATTSPDDIYSPDAGQQYALTQDLLLMADSVQDALTDVRTGIRTFAGTNSARTAVTPNVGDYWTTTDTSPQRGYRGTSSGWALDRSFSTSFTPAWTNFIPGTSSVNASYSVSGGRLYGRIVVVLAPGWAMNANGITFTAPLAPVSPVTMAPIGDVVIIDSGTGYRRGVSTHASSTQIGLWANIGDWLGAVNGAGNPIGWASGDQFSVTFSYEV